MNILIRLPHFILCAHKPERKSEPVCKLEPAACAAVPIQTNFVQWNDFRILKRATKKNTYILTIYRSTFQIDGPSSKAFRSVSFCRSYLWASGKMTDPIATDSHPYLSPLLLDCISIRKIIHWNANSFHLISV